MMLLMPKKKENVHYFKRLSLTIFSLTFLLNTNVLGFGNKTHYAITKSAFVTTKMFSKFDSLDERLRLKEVLVNACNLPDEEESSWFFKWHFYNPMPTKTNKIEDLLTTDDNALKRTLLHYNKAVECFNTDKAKSIKELGASLHYIQDCCCPVHLLGWSSWEHNKPVNFFERKHGEYERKMDEQSSGFEYDLFYEEKKFNFKNVFELQGVLNAYPLATWIDYNERKQIEPTYKVFKNAHEASCELIYLFFKEVGIEL